MKIIECQQGSDAWWIARRGVPTASRFDSIITPKKGELSSGAYGYICELLAEKAIGGVPDGVESYTSRAMQYGTDTERIARQWYAMEADTDVTQVGFCLTDDGRFGCSPDGLVGNYGGVEIKCPLPKTHVEYLLDDRLPDAYKTQVHGSLIVTGRAYWDFVSYCIGLPPLCVRVEPDKFTDKMRGAMEQFWTRYKQSHDQMEALGAFDQPEATEEEIILI